jgi:hypothetical protein
MKKVTASKSKASKPAAKAKPAAKKPVKAAKAAAKPLKAAKVAAKPVKAAAKAAPVAKTAAKLAGKAPAKAAPKVPAKALGKAAPVTAPAKAAKGAKAPVEKSLDKSLEKAAKVAKSPVEKSPDKAPAVAKEPKPAKVAKAPAKAPEPKVEVRSIPEEPDTAEDVVLTDADGRRYCRTKDCDRLAEVDNYCRYHYILLWKNIQIRRNILQEGKLGRYVEELTARYPDKFLEILKKDLRSEKDFLAAIQELEIDESAVEAEFDDEEAQSDLFEIQRVSDAGNAGDRSDSDDRF